MFKNIMYHINTTISYLCNIKTNAPPWLHILLYWYHSLSWLPERVALYGIKNLWRNTTFLCLLYQKTEGCNDSFLCLDSPSWRGAARLRKHGSWLTACRKFRALMKFTNMTKNNNKKSSLRSHGQRSKYQNRNVGILVFNLSVKVIDELNFWCVVSLWFIVSLATKLALVCL